MPLKIKNLDNTARVLIVGLGLIGGSYARALTKQGFAVTAITLGQADIDYARCEGFISEGYTEVDPAVVGAADIVVLALYPHTLISWAERYAKYFTPGTLVTDVTGVKANIADTLQPLMPEGVEFIAAHPMAGREKSGVEHSDDSVFHGANYIVVPTENNTPMAIDTAKRLGEILGFARISVLSPEEHDKMIGFVSQLTHCIAVALMTCNDNTHLVDYTGDSFRDLTRIANINEDMWTELFLLNRDVLANEIDVFAKELERIKDMLKNGDSEGMKEVMRLSTKRRKLFNK